MKFPLWKYHYPIFNGWGQDIVLSCGENHNIQYDYDIVATTSCGQFINGKFSNQRVVTYTAKKPHKKLFTEQDLFNTDTFSFGTQIG